MTEHLDKTTITRLAWLTELRRQGNRQCRNEYRQGMQVCALGLLQEVAGINDFKDDVGYIVAHAGLSRHQGNTVVDMNDGRFGEKHTFAEIADVVEDWFR